MCVEVLETEWMTPSQFSEILNISVDIVIYLTLSP